MVGFAGPRINFKPRWAIKNLVGAMDAHVLANGNVLVAENARSRVSERDKKTGNIIWEYTIANPVHALAAKDQAGFEEIEKRLPHGPGANRIKCKPSSRPIAAAA